MTEKWTPGPWHIERDDAPGMEWNNHICSETGRICFMAHESPDWTNDGLEAAAHLIASAPALYEALELAVEAFLSDPPSGPQKSIVGDDVIYHLDGQTLGHALNKARTALRAARGEQS